MIQVEGVSLAYATEELLDGVSFVINQGDRCGVVGRNGSGKSTLFRLLMGKETPDKGTISIAKGYTLGMLDQHIRLTAPTILEEACLGLPKEERDQSYRAEKILFGLGFGEMNLEVLPTSLSGGFQLRLHLAKLLLSEPNCLLLDEPTNYLDIISTRFLQKTLARWDGELMLISHDREFMDAISTHTLGVHRKKVKKLPGGTEEFFTQIVLEEEIHEKTRVNVEKKKAHLQSFVDRFGAKATKAAQAQARQKAIAKMPALEMLKSLYNLDFAFRYKSFPGEKMGEIKEISFSYTPEREIVRNLSLFLEPGDRIGVIGKNGFGKSTILRLIGQELTPNSGSINYSEQVSIGYFGQTNVERLATDKTIEEEIKAANRNLNYSDVKAVCGQMMFSGTQSTKKIEYLSGGERSRVLLGKIIANPCNLLLLDEPTHHLDIESVEALIDALEEFPGTFIIVTHSELILKRLVLDKLIVCHKDRHEIHLGGYEEFLEKVGWEEEKPAPKEVKRRPEERRDPREKERKQVEAALIKLEEIQAKEFHEMAEFAHDREKALVLAKRTKAREVEIEALYEKLKQLDR